MKPNLLILLCLTFFCGNAFAQNNTANKNVIAKFAGEWYSKKDKRTLNIEYDAEYHCFRITDHTKGYSEDAYSAYPKEDKLVMYLQNSDHHAPYCELNIISNQLIYECNSALNFKDNFLVRDQYSDKTVFKKIK